MTLAHVTLAVAAVIVVAFGLLVSCALRQRRQSQHIATHVHDTKATAERVEARFETVTARCQTGLGGMKCRLSRVEIGS